MINVICPFYNEAKNVHEFMSGFTSEKYRLICINDGSKDRTLEAILAGLKHFGLTGRVINYKHNVGLERAILAGLIHSDVDSSLFVVMDTDLQDPVELIPSMESMTGSYDLINAYRVARPSDTLFKRVTAMVYYRLTSYLVPREQRLNRDHGNFKMFSSEIAYEFRRRKRFVRSFRFDILHYSNRPGWKAYERRSRSYGATNYTLKDLLREANLSIPVSHKWLFFLVGCSVLIYTKCFYGSVIFIIWMLYSLRINSRKNYIEPDSILEI